MQILQISLLFLVIALAFPLGFLLARATKEEIEQGRKAFIAVIISCFLVVLFSLFYNFMIEQKLLLITSMLFIAALTSVSLKKSFCVSKKSKK